MGHPAAVPGPGRRAGRDHRPDQPEPVHHPVRLPPRVLRRRSSASSAASAWSSSWDTEDLAVLEAAADRFANLDRATDLPPVLTRTWLHTGVFPDENWVSRQYAREYWRQPGGGDPDLPDTALPGTLRLAGKPPRPWRLSRTEAREACRALKGMPLREEVYALDGSEAQDRPYLVTEHNYTIELLQPAITPVPDGPQNYHAVLLTHARESVTAHYERVLYPVDGELRADPRITHDVVLAVDDYGNPLRSASAGYGRRYPDPALAPRGPGGAGAAAADLHRERATPTRSTCRTRTARRCPRRRGPSRWSGWRPAGRLFGFAELRDGLAAVTAELPFQDWDAGPAAPARARAAADRQPRCGTGATTCPGRCRSASWSRSRCRTGATARRSPTAWSPTCTGTQVDAGTLRAAGYLARAGPGGCRPAGCSTPPRRRRPGRRAGLRPAALLPAAPVHRPVRQHHGRQLRPLRPAGDADAGRARQPRHRRRTRSGRRAHHRRQRLPGAGAAPGQRPEPEPGARWRSTRSAGSPAPP